MADLPDPNAPLSDYEKALLEKLLADPTQFPSRFKAWVSDYVANNGNFHIDNLPTLAGEEWRTPTFAGNWGNYGGSQLTTRFYKDVTGIVRIAGTVTRSGGVAAAAETIFTLPEGYRPSADQMFACSAGDPAGVGVTDQAFARVDVESDGEVRFIRWSRTLADPEYLGLDNISFRAA